MTKQILIALGTLAIAFGAGPAWSDEKEKEGHVAELAKAAKVPVTDAITTATNAVKGTIVEAELEKKHDKTVWEVEVLEADGKVIEVHIDAVTGQVIDKEEKAEKHEGKKKKGK
jgi:uncharacterized membrane protein YkoI